MPLLIVAQLKVEKYKDENDPKAHRQESFTDDEIEEVKSSLLDFSTLSLLNLENPPEYVFSVHNIDLISPVKDLRNINIPLPELRQALAHKMGEGINGMNLEDLLFLIRSVYRENEV